MTSILPASVRNRRLFSEYFLEKMLDDLADWKDESYKMGFERAREIWKRYDVLQYEKMNEAQLEENLIKPILRDVLGHHIIVQETTSLSKRPDYLFFRDKKDEDSAYTKEGEERYRDATGLGDAKEWNVRLDGGPSRQVVGYLRYNRKRWGILTNGRVWRLFFEGKPEDTYYEVNLEYMIEEGKGNFRYFYNFFRLKAFIEDESGKAFLDRVLKRSRDYAEKVGDDLKERVYRALRRLSEGFFSHLENKLDKNREKDIKNVQQNAMIVLYRMLFLLYAEGKGLLSIENSSYRENYSIYKVKNEVWRNKPKYSRGSTGLWNKLQDSFTLINYGSEAMGISKEKLYVPPYNGGLFAKRALDRWKIGDTYMAEAIDLLSRTNAHGITGDFIDYSTLEIRHLGGIYEGLLEYRLKIAEEDMVSDGKKWMSLDEYNAKRKRKKNFEDFPEDMKVRKGGLYLATDKGERKATGSYYTPDYIVDYIVENTLGPIVDEKTKGLEGKEEIMDAFLSTKVLDPAMGSGHFLVGAVEYLAQRLVDAVSEVSEEMDINEARRLIVSHCIYGVDINPMAVELAKVALWLTTISKDRPLSFLDHRLKCGNSLIGATLEDLPWHPIEKGEKIGKSANKVSGYVEKLVRTVKKMDEIKDETLEDVKKKEALFQEMSKSYEYEAIKTLADVHMSIYFGNQVSGEVYGKFSGDVYHYTKKEWEEKKKRLFVKDAEKIAKEKRFFHWELEFPEVFFDLTGPKENPGFDAVIGNPPYDVISEKEQKREVDNEKKFFLSSPIYRHAVGSKLNYYRLFISLSINLLKQNGWHGFIVPMALIGDAQAKPLREFLLKNICFKLVEAFPQKDDPKNRVFFDAKLSTCIYILKKSKPEHFSLRIHPGKYILEDIEYIVINPEQIEIFDSENLSFPSYPGSNQRDFDLALKLIEITENVRLRYYAVSQQGEVNLTSHKEFLSDEPIGPIVLRGAHIGRYEFQEQPKQGVPKYLDKKKFLSAHSPDTKAYDYRYTRIGYQRGSAIDNWRRIISTIIEKGNFCSDTINYIVNPKDVNIYFLLSLLNSSLWEWRFRLTSTNNHVNSYEIDGMPIRHISFTTPPGERRALLEEFKEMYAEVVG